MTNLYSDLHNLYSISKTLRFELRPIGKTLENFQQHILEQDEIKSETFKNVKLYCDEYHKYFIEQCLSQMDSSKLLEDLHSYEKLFFEINKTTEKNKKESSQKEFKKIEEKLRKLVAKAFTENDTYKKLFKDDMIKSLLPEYFQEYKEKIKEIELFQNFTTYFTGYNTNRENMYSYEEKSTAIAFRLINQNLPIYFKNILSFRTIQKDIPSIIEDIKKELGTDITAMFSNIENYSNILTQKQIEAYNLVISGKSEENRKLQGINEIVNLYNQKNSIKLPKLKMLYKQILSDKNTNSFSFDSIENDEQVILSINTYYEDIFKKIIDECTSTINNIIQFDASKIYINNDKALTSLSKYLFEDWSYINDLRITDFNTTQTNKKKKRSDEDIQKELEKESELSLQHIDYLITTYSDTTQTIFSYFKDKTTEYIKKIGENYTEYKSILELESTKNLIQDENAIEKIKNFLDSLKDFQFFVKGLIPKNKLLAIDETFYNGLHYDILQEIIPLYNKIRNYLTKKPYSTEKIKLTFNCPTLMNGWDLNKEDTNLTVLFQKNGKYYLGIINKKRGEEAKTKSKKIFETYIYDDSPDYYEKMEYKLFPDVKKQIPKCSTQVKKVKEHFSTNTEDYTLFNEETWVKPLIITKEIFDLNNVADNIPKKFQKDYLDNTGDEKGYRQALKTWIQFCLNFLECYKSTSIYDLSAYNPEYYDSLDKFYDELNSKLYKIQWSKVSNTYIDNLVETGQLFLFQVYSKDFSPYSKGTPNLHTLYWKALFDKDNLNKDIIYKLNGQSEIFYRKKSIEYTESVKINGHHYEELKDKFSYPIIKDKRYTVDKFLFHVPITLNYTSQNKNSINEIVNTSIKNTNDIHIIGVDRGERHLIYITVINLKGEIIEQFSLNKIINFYNQKEYPTDYHNLLERKEKERKNARENWKTITTIKELKEGYMSQVIHKIVELMYKYNAIIALEDLNSGFKNSRKKVEKQVYDKFETMLINKLSYLVSKNIEDKFALGGLFNAYQLVNQESKGKQTGVLFYIPAWNTSNIDPTTGFVNLFNLKITNLDKFKEFISKFDDMRFNEKKHYFEFVFDYSNFTEKATETKTSWTLCTYGTRIKKIRDKQTNNNWNYTELHLTQEFKNMFEEHKIDIRNIKEGLVHNPTGELKDAFMSLFKLMLQMRNSIPNSETDYIISPVENNNGTFYDSRNNISILPQNADANGAYNIARKGLMLIERIKNTEDAKINTSISNKEWLKFAQK